MKYLFLVNEVGALEPRQTTVMLIMQAVSQGYEVYVSDVSDFSCSPEGQVRVRGRRIKATGTTSAATLINHVGQIAPTPVSLGAGDVLVIRTNPARHQEKAWAHTFVMQLTQWLQKEGVAVVNDPAGLMRASNKLYLLELPAAVRPLTLVSQWPKEIKSFIEEIGGPAVLKPLLGTRGEHVFFVSSAEDKNINQMLDVLLQQSAIMVQEYLPDAHEGDTRVIVCNGEILKIHGDAAAINRVPGKGELRSNIHAGGTAQLGVITQGIQKAVDTVGDKLVQDGLILAGLDFIGGKIIEANVFSPGGLFDAERFTGQAFTAKIIEAFSSIASRNTMP